MLISNSETDQILFKIAKCSMLGGDYNLNKIDFQKLYEKTNTSDYRDSSVLFGTYLRFYGSDSSDIESFIKDKLPFISNSDITNKSLRIYLRYLLTKGKWSRCSQITESLLTITRDSTIANSWLELRNLAY